MRSTSSVAEHLTSNEKVMSSNLMLSYFFCFFCFETGTSKPEGTATSAG